MTILTEERYATPTSEGAYPYRLGALVIGSVDNLIYPILVGNKIRLHTLLVFSQLLEELYCSALPG